MALLKKYEFFELANLLENSMNAKGELPVGDRL